MTIKRKLIGAVLASILINPAWASDKSDHEDKSQALNHQHMQVSDHKNIKEATKALEMTSLALKQLDENKKDEALQTLALVTGQLEIIIAQHPDLAFAPIDSQVTVLDYQGDKKSVRKIREEAADLLEDGRLQEARLMIRDIASEIVISTRKLPLATYPEVIKSVVPMINKGNIDQAKETLERALSTVVVTQEVIPLPVLRASTAISSAKELAKENKRDDKANRSLQKLLNEARQQLEWAETLGYGDKDAYQALYDSISDIEKKTAGGAQEQGLFDKLKEKIKALTE